MNASALRRWPALGAILAGLLTTTAVGLELPTAAQIKTAFNALDSRRAGMISLKDWDTASFTLFRALDKNNDEFIDRVELQAGNLAPDTFLRADLNRDDRLSVSEFVGLRRALFQTADIDRDDRLSPAEYELLILMERVGWQDANQNGRIELSELTRSLEVAFAGLDKDGDGALTATEAAYMRPETFKRYDTNHDGRLSLEGLRNDLEFFKQQKYVQDPNITVERIIDTSFVEQAVKDLGPYKPHN